ncbi:MAG TPA: ABC transporter ATP-binding protein, partial [Nakamurella sp.]|nr:ABC transporter ATP-binding protein [Nakamurella sp.]
MTAATGTVLDIDSLVVEFDTPEGTVRAVDGVSYSVSAGETLAVVGETGSGKSVTVLAAFGLLDAGRIVSGTVRFGGQDLLRMPDKRLRRLLGSELTMVFQNPMSALNPVMTVGRQVAETLVVHDRKLSNAAARARSIELLSMVGVPQPDVRYDQYPHEFSGGMCQRVVIAMAIANNPKVIIADEPTTAVDVTVQAQLLELLRVARQETGAAVV